MWKRVAYYGVLLAVGTLALQWLDYQRLARVHSGDIYVFLIAVAFLMLGVIIGKRVFAGPGQSPERVISRLSRRIAGNQQMIPSSRAFLTASVRRLASSFSNSLATWVLTVLGETWSCAAISLLERPAASSRKTASSCSLIPRLASALGLPSKVVGAGPAKTRLPMITPSMRKATAIRKT